LNFYDTPTTQKTTPSLKDFKPDLTAVGYTSVFLQLPNSSPPAALPLKSNNLSTPVMDKRNSYSHIPIPPVPASPTKTSKTHKRFRSLSILRTRSKSTTVPASPTKATTTKAVKASVIVSHKKAKYASVRPAPLANDLALMQFADGGRMDTHIKRVMEAQAKAAAVGGVSDVYRDGQGGIWWDAEEEWEYAHLLGGEEQVGVEEWVEFSEKQKRAAVAIAEMRRGSGSTVSTQDSDLDVRYVMQPAESNDDLAAFGSALAPMSLNRPGMSVLTLPAHTRRAAKHMHKPEHLLDDAFPCSPGSPRSPPFHGDCSSPTRAKPKGKDRRRPEPLKLSPPSPAAQCPRNSPIDPEKVRKDFLDNSFSPPVNSSSMHRGRPKVRNLSDDSTSSATTITTARRGVAKKASLRNVKAFFRSGKKEEY
jgi:hypothetical protein